MSPVPATEYEININKIQVLSIALSTTKPPGAPVEVAKVTEAYDKLWSTITKS